MPGLERVASLQTEGALTPGDVLMSPDGSRLAILQSHRVLFWDLGVVRQELKRLGLAEGLPAWRRQEVDASPLRAQVVPDAARK